MTKYRPRIPPLAEGRVLEIGAGAGLNFAFYGKAVRKACTSANVRISKCGGLVAAMRRCREALDAGWILQVGCQVGESSILSAAHLALVSEVENVTYLEGCFGLHLLTEDPVETCLQFGLGGRAPSFAPDKGLGVSMNEDRLWKYVVRSATIGDDTGGSS